MKKTVTYIIGGFFAWAFATVLNLIKTLFVMLGVGVLHSYWSVIPAFGFWETFLVMTAFTTVFVAFRPNVAKDD